MDHSFRIGFIVIALVMLADYSSAQRANQNVPQCGAALVSIQNPSYLKTTDQGMIVVELPKGWSLDKSRPDLFYILKSGDTYESARTLMYIRVEALQVSLKQAVLNDIASFKSSCERSIIEDLKRPPLLENGCESNTQMFSCKSQKNSFIDLVTKIAFTKSLLNVVLSADKPEDIEKYRRDYDFLLQHLTMIKSQK
jgi:hypothetical protein